MHSKIFLIDVLLNRIQFEENYKEVPNSNEIIIIATFSDLLKMYLDPKEFDNIINHKDERTWGLNIGKSCIFTYNFQSLLYEMKKYPLEISIKLRNRKLLGKSIIPWRKEFSDMVKIFQQIGVVKSVDYTNDIDIKDKDIKIGVMHFYVRMACGGDGVETDFRIKNDLGQDNWILFHTKNMKGVLCSSFYPENDKILPVARLYNVTLNPPCYEATNIPWIEAPREGKQSDEVGMVELFSGSSNFDVVSVCLAPNANILDFFTSESKKYSTRSMKEKKDKEQENLKIDNICVRLCIQSKCPGVRKFENIGIYNPGTRKDLSGIEPKNESFLSHFHTNIERYNPQSVFMSPKNPNTPFTTTTRHNAQLRTFAVTPLKNCKSVMKCSGAVSNAAAANNKRRLGLRKPKDTKLQNLAKDDFRNIKKKCLCQEFNKHIPGKSNFPFSNK